MKGVEFYIDPDRTVSRPSRTDDPAAPATADIQQEARRPSGGSAGPIGDRIALEAIDERYVEIPIGPGHPALDIWVNVIVHRWWQQIMRVDERVLIACDSHV